MDILITLQDSPHVQEELVNTKQTPSFSCAFCFALAFFIDPLSA